MKRDLLLATLIATSTACGSEDAPAHSSDDTNVSTGSTRDGGTAEPTERDAGRDAGHSTGPSNSPSNNPSSNNSPPVSAGAPDPNAPPPLCQNIDISTGRVAPDVLIVLDRSSSMKTDMVNRWDPSVSGLTSITAKLESQIRFGLMAFPGPGNATDGGGERCAPGELDVPIELNNAAPIAAKLTGYELVNSTPTAGTLEAAHTIFKTRKAPADMGTLGTPYVVLVTDGAPNCNGRDFTPNGFDQPAFQASVAAITSMAKDGIKTFVLGYDANSDPQLKMSLDAMAVAGDTGDTEHHEIENEAGLIDAFTAIAGKAVSCDFTLSEPPADPSYVLVKVGGQQLNYGDPNGWSLSDDKLTLTLQGDSCGKLPKVEGSHVSVQVQCVVVPVQ
jgi:hypothetical protein